MDDDDPGRPQPVEPPPRSVWKLEPLRAMGRGRLIRFGLLVVALVALAVATVVVRAWERRAREQRAADVASAVEEIRNIVGTLSGELSPEALMAALGHADLLYGRVKELDPENREVEQLAVPLCYAAGRFDEVVGLFNGLDVLSLAKGMDREPFLRASSALAEFDMLKPEAASPLMDAKGVYYIRACGLLWALAAQVTAGAADDAEKAVRLCRWMALHVLPEASDCSPGDPHMVVWRAYASPAQAAWTYAELARQAGLRARVVVAAEGGSADEHCLVQVYPAEGAPLLLDPHAGVPILDARSGAFISLQDVQEKPDSLASLAALPGGQVVPPAERLNGAATRIAVSVEACFPRFLVFDHLLRLLPERPEVGLSALSSPDEEVALWDVPAALRQKMGSGETAEEEAHDFGFINAAQPARLMQLRGQHGLARVAYEARIADLARKTAEAEVEESVAVLREGLDYTAFFAASNAQDAGDYETAETLARGYLEQHADGRWRLLAQLVLAECLSAKGDAAGAEAIWRDLPASRRLYGALRAGGLLAGMPARAAAPEGPAGAVPPGPP